MKKWVLAFGITFGMSIGAVTLPTAHVEAQAKEYDMKPNLVNALKKGTLPWANGKVGMTYKALKKVEKNEKEHIGDPYYYVTSKKYDDRYAFWMDYRKWEKVGFKSYKPYPTDKVSYIERQYDYLISKKSVEKYFGKPYKGIPYEPTGKKQKWVTTGIYKAGKYYLSFTPYNDQYNKITMITVGDKNSVMLIEGVKKIYR